jgi:hypothetical protein
MLPHRGRWSHLIEDLAGALDRLRVDVRLNTPVTASAVRDFGADVTVIATGATWDASGRSVHRPDRDAIPRTAGSHVIDPVSAIRAPESCGPRVVIVDDLGTYLALGLAEQLALTRTEVTLISPHAQIGHRLGPLMTADLGWAHPRLVAAGVEILTSSSIERIEPGRVAVTSDGATAGELAADTVIVITRREPDDGLYCELRDAGVAVLRIGDCVAPREVDDAIFEAAREGAAI